MKKSLLLVGLLTILLVLFLKPGSAYPWYANNTENDTYFNVSEPLNLSVQWTGNTTHGANFTFLSTNETGAWVNYTSTSGRYANLGNDTTWTRTDFNWTNTTYCGLNFSWRSYTNNTAAEWNVTPIRQIQPFPLLNGTLTAHNNISNCKCDNATHMLCNWEGIHTGVITALLNDTFNGSQRICSYNAENVTNYTSTNLTRDCYIKAYVDSTASGWRLLIYEVAPVSPYMPIDLPVAITLTGFVSFTVIVTFSILRKKAGWT